MTFEQAMSLPLAQPEMCRPRIALLAPTAFLICRNARLQPATLFGKLASSGMPEAAFAAHAHNPFHEQELTREQFVSLLRIRFQNVLVLEQPVCTALTLLHFASTLTPFLARASRNTCRCSAIYRPSPPAVPTPHASPPG